MSYLSMALVVLLLMVCSDSLDPAALVVAVLVLLVMVYCEDILIKLVGMAILPMVNLSIGLVAHH